MLWPRVQATLRTLTRPPARRMEKLRVDTDYSLAKKQGAMDEKVKGLENEREREAQRAQERCAACSGG